MIEDDKFDKAFKSLCCEAAFQIGSENLILQEIKRTDPIMCNVDNAIFENLIKFARAVKHHETFKLMPNAPKVIVDDVSNTVSERFETIKKYDNQFVGKAIEMLLYASVVNLTDNFVITCSLCEQYYKCQKESGNNIIDECDIFAYFLSEIDQVRIINIKLAEKYNFNAIKIREISQKILLSEANDIKEIIAVRTFKQKIAQESN